MSRLWVQLLRVRVVSGEAAPLELHARVPLLRRLGCLLDVRLLQLLLLLLLLLLHLQQGVQRLCSARYRIRLPPAGHQRASPSTRHPCLVPASRSPAGASITSYSNRSYFYAVEGVGTAGRQHAALEGAGSAECNQCKLSRNSKQHEQEGRRDEEPERSRSLSDAHDANDGAGGCAAAAAAASSRSAYSGRARDDGVVWVLDAVGDGERARA